MLAYGKNKQSNQKRVDKKRVDCAFDYSVYCYMCIQWFVSLPVFVLSLPLSLERGGGERDGLVSSDLLFVSSPKSYGCSCTTQLVYSLSLHLPLSTH